MLANNLLHGGITLEVRVFNLDGLLCIKLLKDGKSIGKCDISKKSSDTFFIEELVISHNYRNKGYGRKFMEHIINSFKNYNLTLIAHPFFPGSISKTSLINFYKSLGFKRTHSDNITMIKHKVN